MFAQARENRDKKLTRQAFSNVRPNSEDGSTDHSQVLGPQLLGLNSQMAVGLNTMLLVLGVVVGFGAGGIGMLGVNDADGLNAGALAAAVGKKLAAVALGLKTGAIGA